MRTIELYEYGHVTLEKVMGDDLDIVNNAKISFDKRSTEMGDHEKGLLNFLMRERHGSPWEAVVFRFVIRAPIFVNREHFRHRVGSFNEESGRYSTMKLEAYVPSRQDIRTQTGSPGKYTFKTLPDDREALEALDMIRDTQAQCFATYEGLLAKGVAREVARNVLPLSTFSSFVWTVNLRSLFNFLALRNHEHALREIRQYAVAIEELTAAACPYAFELFNQHGRVCP